MLEVFLDIVQPSPDSLPGYSRPIHTTVHVPLVEHHEVSDLFLSPLFIAVYTTPTGICHRCSDTCPTPQSV